MRPVRPGDIDTFRRLQKTLCLLSREVWGLSEATDFLRVRPRPAADTGHFKLHELQEARVEMHWLHYSRPGGHRKHEAMSTLWGIVPGLGCVFQAPRGSLPGQVYQVPGPWLGL
jgi:hypothetical protein